MKQREHLNTKEGFEEIIEFNNSAIIEFLEKIKKLEEAENKGVQIYPKPNLEVIKSTKNTILEYQYELLICKYSVGKTLDEIKEEYRKTINRMEGVWHQSNGYIQMIWMLSIGIMLKADKSIFEKLKSLVEKDNPNDYLIDFLLSSKTDCQIKNTMFKFPEPYASLKEVIDLANDNQKEKATQRLKKYLGKEWYKGHSDCGWYNSHKSEYNTHYGYWSFESGAISKILGLDDSTLQEQKYYPYDMVHWED